MCGEYTEEHTEVEPGSAIIGTVSCGRLGLSCTILRDDLEGWIWADYQADRVDGEIPAADLEAIPGHAKQFADAAAYRIRRALADAGPGYTWHERTPASRDD